MFRTSNDVAFDATQQLERNFLQISGATWFIIMCVSVCALGAGEPISRISNCATISPRPHALFAWDLIYEAPEVGCRLMFGYGTRFYPSKLELAVCGGGYLHGI